MSNQNFLTAAEYRARFTDQGQLKEAQLKRQGLKTKSNPIAKANREGMESLAKARNAKQVGVIDLQAIDKPTKKKPRKSSKKEESRIQKSCVRWFRSIPAYKNYVLFSVPNGGFDFGGDELARTIQGKRLKDEGLLSGVSDLILIAAGRTIYLECKTLDGSQSESQKEFEEKVKVNGLPYFVFRSLDQFMDIVKPLLS